MPNTVKPIVDFINKLNKKNHDLLMEYVNNEYAPKSRNKRFSKFKKFINEHNSPEGIKIVQELLKFKKMCTQNKN